jgi:hypothetical protein
MISKIATVAAKNNITSTQKSVWMKNVQQIKVKSVKSRLIEHALNATSAMKWSSTNLHIHVRIQVAQNTNKQQFKATNHSILKIIILMGPPITI